MQKFPDVFFPHAVGLRYPRRVITAPSQRLATADDLAALPPHRRAEVITGSIEEKAAPSYEHGEAQSQAAHLLCGPFHGRGGGSKPGGWWIASEVEVEFETHEVYVPDLVGWRRDRVPARPVGRPVRIRPDWVCEVISPSTAGRDLIVKHRTLHRCQVPHYWIIDPDQRTLAVHRWHADGYIVVLRAGATETVRAEPFDAIALPVGQFFGEEEKEK